MGWFRLSWIIIVSAVSISCQQLTTLLPQDEDACARSEVTLTCTIRGLRNLTSLILAWSSDEYIGNGKVLRFLSIDMPGTNNITSMINENVTAVLTNNTVISGVPELVSVLHIVGANQRSVITCESVTNESSASTVISISALPEQPQNVVARELSAGSCDFLVTWDPPTNIDRSDINRYMIYVPLRNIAELEVSTTTVLSVSDCDDSNIRIEVSAVNNFECEGLNSTEIQPSLLERPTILPVDTQRSATIAGGVVGGFLLLIIIIIIIVGIIFGICSYVRLNSIKDQKINNDQLHARQQDDLQRDLEYLLAALKFDSSSAIKEYVRRLKEIMKKTPSSYIKEALVRALDKIKWEKNGQYVRKALVNLTKLIPKTTFDEKLKDATTSSGKAWTMDMLIGTLRRGGFQTVFDTLISEVDKAEADSVKKLLQNMCDQLQKAIDTQVKSDQSEKETEATSEPSDESEHQEVDKWLNEMSPGQAKEFLLEVIKKLQEKVANEAKEATDGATRKDRNSKQPLSSAKKPKQEEEAFLLESLT